MINAEISIHDSIKEVSKSTEDKRLKAIFATLNDDLNQGQSLTDAITKFKGELGDVVIAMVKLGESTGNMSESLHKLSEILHEVWENQRKFKKAMRYPIIVMSGTRSWRRRRRQEWKWSSRRRRTVRRLESTRSIFISFGIWWRMHFCTL